jgi:perosamine synthetase
VQIITEIILKNIMIPKWINVIKNPQLFGEKIYPIYAPIFLGKEKQYLTECIDGSWISPKGNFVNKFEDAYANITQSKYAIGCASGTAALRLSLIALNIGPGDEVIVPSMTMISTAFVVSYVGAKPVFIDSQPDTGNLDVSLIESLITPKTKAIIPVHLYGNPCQIDLVNQIAKKHHLDVVEDAAEAIGSEFDGKKIGSISILSAFSAYVNKIVTTGQGGMITTNSEKLYKFIKKYNNYYFSDTRHFWHEKIGYNFKLSNLQAAVGLAQIEKFDDLLAKKVQISIWYNKLLQEIKSDLVPLAKTAKSKSNEWMVAYLLTDPKGHAQKLREYLAKNGIETRTFFIPLHLQPAYRDIHDGRKLPISENLCRRGLLLPSGPGLSINDITYIASKITAFFK